MGSRDGDRLMIPLPDGDAFLSLAETAELIGVKPASLRTMRSRGDFLDPDGDLGRSSPAWLRSRVLESRSDSVESSPSVESVPACVQWSDRPDPAEVPTQTYGEVPMTDEVLEVSGPAEPAEPRKLLTLRLTDPPEPTNDSSEGPDEALEVSEPPSSNDRLELLSANLERLAKPHQRIARRLLAQDPAQVDFGTVDSLLLKAGVVD